MNKIIKQYVILVAVVYIISLFTAPHPHIIKNLFYSAVIVALAMFGFWCQSGSKGKNTVIVPNRKQAIYVYENLARQYKYRIEGEYIYEGMSSKFSYRLMENKIYVGMSASPIYVIKDNVVYDYMGNSKPVYIIDGNYIYKGDGTRVPVYEISAKAYR